MNDVENSQTSRKRPRPARAKILDLFRYDPDTGVFRNVIDRGQRAHAGMVAGHKDKRSGYRRLKVDGVAYEAHRLAWLIMTGEWPEIVDHINGERDDNRWCNLREVNASQNMMNRKVGKNNKVGSKGVRRTPSGRYRAQIGMQGRNVSLGTFDTIDEAARAYGRAAEEYFGEYAKGIA